MMCEVGMLTTQLLENLAAGSKSFKLNLKTNDIDISLSSQDKEVIPEDPGHVKRKSPSQKKQYFQRRKLYLEKKLCSYHTSPFNIDRCNSHVHAR